MDIFEYIASNDEYSARAICSKYGYDLQNAVSPEDVGVCLKQLTGVVGEPAMFDILSLHPDKDVIVETFGTPSEGGKKSGCGCKSHKAEAFVPQPGNTQLKESHIFIFAGALLLAAAIIAK